MEDIDGIPVDLGLLPDDLRPLADLIRRYSVGDDVEGSKRLEAASSDELQQLVDAVTPHWDGINAYLDEHMDETGTPEQDVALVISGFAERAAEARFALEERE